MGNERRSVEFVGGLCKGNERRSVEFVGGLCVWVMRGGAWNLSEGCVCWVGVWWGMRGGAWICRRAVVCVGNERWSVEFVGGLCVWVMRGGAWNLSEGCVCGPPVFYTYRVNEDGNEKSFWWLVRKHFPWRQFTICHHLPIEVDG
ncbi:hypothetical protein HNY73_010668 [Argiope bruennichi]|uniref:Uncharacterized protein n=1 Tax=Argiope bruennichi TaxID=94029 RepID=A0A8T0F1R8_ARGBR|nr:hypothetical protein HNY73_010668 [Argiope bruennichi]